MCTSTYASAPGWWETSAWPCSRPSARACSPLGAARVRLLLADEENESCLVMQDVEGNEFCLD